MIVAIDAGNTRTKWATFDAAGRVIGQGSIANAHIETLADQHAQWQGCRRAVISNVAGAEMAARLLAVCDGMGLPVRWVRSAHVQCGVHNGYAQPDLLGSDRWAALVAAWNRLHQPCVVATAGTALTVDALSATGEFLGGLILPGYNMMCQSLLAGTAGLTRADGVLAVYPDNTADAIASGAWNAMAGAVERMLTQLELRESCAARCLLAGGDAQGLSAVLSRPAEIADNLVLEGLMLIEREAE
jgi:type III pantothenate kinase